MSFDNIPDNGNPKSGSVILGAKKRIKDLAEVFLPNPAACILNTYHIMVFFLGHIHGHATAIFHGLNSIHKNIEESPVKELWVSPEF